MYGDFQNFLLSPLVILYEKTVNNTSGTHLVNDMAIVIVRKELLTLKIKIYGRFDCKFLNCLYVKDAKNVWKSLIWQANLKARSSTVRIADFNIYYCIFVLVFKCNISIMKIYWRKNYHSTNHIYEQRRYYLRDFLIWFFHIQYNRYKITVI